MKRKAISGINSFLMIIIVAGIVSALYYIADRHPLRYDFTSNKTQTLSNKTIKVLGGLDRNIEIIGFLENGSMPAEMIEDLLKEYRRRTDKISFTTVDPTAKPGEAQKYGITEFGVVLKSGDNKKFIKLKEMFETSQNPYSQEPPKFFGEQAITNALISITGKDKRRVCFIEGHGERDFNAKDESGYSGIKDLLEGENYEVAPLNLMTEKNVPATCSIIATIGPAKPLSGDEIETVRQYLNKGGAGLFLLDAMKQSGLEPLLHDWGVRVDNDLVIDPERYYGNDPLSPVPYMKPHKITAELMSTKLTISLFYARSITPIEDDKTQTDVETLLETSDRGWGETNVTDENAKYDRGEDVKGPVSVAVAVTGRATPDNDDSEPGEKSQALDRQTRLIVIGDADFASNAFVYQSGLVKALAGGAGNTDFLMNSINWLAGEEELISIRPKPTDIRPMNITGDQISKFTILFAGVVPFLIIIFGVVIWYRRRSL